MSAADLDLVERDPAIPGLAVVLDPAAVLTLVAGHVDGAVIRRARPTYVRYKPGTSCVVGYELATTAGPVLAYAKAHAPAMAAKLAKARLREIRDERVDLGVITNDAIGVLVAPATSDRELPALRAFGDPVRRERLMQSLLPARPDLWDVVPRAIRHKPERRWLGLLEHGGRPVALIKAYRAVDFEHARAGIALLGATDGRPLGWSRRRAALASTWVAGTSLSELLAANLPADMGAVGRALAVLHATTPGSAIVADGSRRLATSLRPAAEAIDGLLPAGGERARRLADAVARAIAGLPQFHCVIHGDFSPDQVVISDNAVNLIDFDQAQVGDPAADLGSFHAELVRAEIEGRLRCGRSKEIFAEVLDSYDRAGGPSTHDRIAVHLAGSLLRLAVTPFRERHPDWPAMCETLLRSAEQCVTRPALTSRRTT